MIKIYSTPSCVFCLRAKTYLQDKQIPFQEVDVSKDAAELGVVVKNTGQMSVPAFEIDGTWLVGYADFMAYLAKSSVLHSPEQSV